MKNIIVQIITNFNVKIMIEFPKEYIDDVCRGLVMYLLVCLHSLKRSRADVPSGLDINLAM